MSEHRRPGRLGFWYRIGWRINYVLLHLYGPPTLGGDGEPDVLTLMRAERERRRLGPAPAPRPARITQPRPITQVKLAVREGNVHVICDLPAPGRSGPPAVDAGGKGPVRAA